MAKQKPITEVMGAPYRVRSPLNHDGVRYEVGSAIDLTPAEAEVLITGGVVELIAVDDANTSGQPPA